MNHMTTILGICSALLLSSSSLAAQVLGEHDVREALAAGAASRLDELRSSRLAYGDELDPVDIAYVYTPRLRIALAAAAARDANRLFGLSDVTREMADLCLYVLVPPRPTMD